jgi:hypothetical protein
MNEIKDLNFMNERLKFTPEEYQEIQQEIVKQ